MSLVALIGKFEPIKKKNTTEMDMETKLVFLDKMNDKHEVILDTEEEEN